MKKIFASLFALSLLACGGSISEKTTKDSAVATTAASPDAGASAEGDFYDVSKWKKVDLKAFNMPLTISVPAEATANKSLNNDKGVQVQFGSKFFFYEITPEEDYTVVGEVIRDKKTSTPSSVTGFKIEKEDGEGFIYSYTEDGKTCRAFEIAEMAGGKVYSISLAGSAFDPTQEQIEKLFNGVKQR